jgi:DNA-directed RNA polymerase subunit N (RpoN/RPB10)
MIPVRCFSCNRVLGHLEGPMTKAIQQRNVFDPTSVNAPVNASSGKTVMGEIFDFLGIKTMCCRTILLSYLDTTEKKLDYDLANEHQSPNNTMKYRVITHKPKKRVHDFTSDSIQEPRKRFHRTNSTLSLPVVSNEIDHDDDDDDNDDEVVTTTGNFYQRREPLGSNVLPANTNTSNRDYDSYSDSDFDSDFESSSSLPVDAQTRLSLLKNQYSNLSM